MTANGEASELATPKEKAAPRQVFVICGESGAGKDYTRWEVAAFRNEGRAEKARDLLQRKVSLAWKRLQRDRSWFDSDVQQGLSARYPDEQSYRLAEDPRGVVAADTIYSVTPVPLNPRMKSSSRPRKARAVPLETGKALTVAAENRLVRRWRRDWVERLSDPAALGLDVDGEGKLWIVESARRQMSGLELDPDEVQAVVEGVIAVFGTDEADKGSFVEAVLPHRGWKFTGLLPPMEMPPIFEIRKVKLPSTSPKL